MLKRELSINDLDSIHSMIAKLCIIHDFFQGYDFEKNSFLKRTPEGFTLIIGECIDSLKNIGGLQ